MARLLITPLLLSLLLACAPDEVGTVSLSAALQVEPEQLSFGRTSVGRTRLANVRVSNRGQVPLLLQASLEGLPASVLGLAADQLGLDVGEEQRLTLRFVPDRPGAVAAVLHLVDLDDPAVGARVLLSGQGLLPDCEDDNPCTEDRFDLDAQACAYTPVDGSCDDGRGCTEGDRCVLGACLGQPVVCDDGHACTVDHCDEAQGCVALPVHERCGGGSACVDAVCDLQLGCLVQAADDGTLCGEPSCAALSLCIGGQCRAGPAPDGFPCEDGDPCSAGDACQAGACTAGPGQGLSVSQPIELELAAQVDSYWPSNPVGVLAVHVPASGGFEVVWVDYPYWQDVSVAILRARFDADGTFLWSQFLAEAELARATYLGDDLILALAGCRSCQQDGLIDCAEDGDSDNIDCWEPCYHQLQRRGPNGDLIHSKCFETGGRYVGELAVSASEQGVDMAYVVSDVVNSMYPPGELKLRHSTPELNATYNVLVETWGSHAHADNQIYPRNLQLGYLDGAPTLAYERAANIGYQGPCGYCDFHTDGCACDDAVGESCNATVPFAAVAAERFSMVPMDSIHYGVVSLAMSSRGIGLSPAPGLAMATWTERYEDLGTDGVGGLCTLSSPVSIVALDTETGDFDTRVLSEYVNGQIAAITGATLREQPAVLVHRSDGVLELLGQGDGDEPLVVTVPRPAGLYGDNQRAFAPLIYYPDHFPPSSVAPLAGGFVAVAITGADYYGGYDTQPAPEEDSGGAASPPAGDGSGASADEAIEEPSLPDRLAVFTAGCGVTIPVAIIEP